MQLIHNTINLMHSLLIKT